jgi:hypothetical protein
MQFVPHREQAASTAQIARFYGPNEMASMWCENHRRHVNSHEVCGVGNSDLKNLTGSGTY